MEDILLLNKKIRQYTGNNTFVLSLQKQLKSTKAKRMDYQGKQIKVLSEKQYQAAKDLLG